jgi:hypothetical protein
VYMHSILFLFLSFIHRPSSSFCLILFPHNAGKWMDVFGVEHNINLLPSWVSTSDDFSWCDHSRLFNAAVSTATVI